MSVRNRLQPLFQQPSLSRALEQLFSRMASNLGPEEREQLNVKASQGQCPLRQLLPDKHKKRF